MIIQEQLDYYYSLTEKQQTFLKIAAFIGHGFVEDDIIYVAYEMGFKYKPREAENILQSASKYQLISREKWYAKYSIDPHFLIFIIPKSKGLKKANSIKKYLQHPETAYHKEVTDCLYALVFQPQKDYLMCEQQLTRMYDSKRTDEVFLAVLRDNQYTPFLKKISPNILNGLLTKRFNEALFSLTPVSKSLTVFSERKDSIPDIENVLSSHLNFAHGKFSKGINCYRSTSDIEQDYVHAIRYLLENDIDNAFDFFENGLKKQRRIDKKSLIPHALHFAFYYYITLLKADLEKTIPLLQKIIEADKNNYYRNILRPVADYALGKMGEMSMHKAATENRIRMDNITGLVAFLTFYICNFKSNKLSYEQVAGLVTAADKGGFYLLACEGAYALHKIYNNEQTAELYKKIAAKTDYEPVLAQLSSTKNWEKTLNLLLGLNTTSETGQKRIIYFFYPKENTVIPAQQSLLKNGWSKGRIVDAHSLQNGSILGMSEHDMRIAKTLRRTYTKECQVNQDFFLEIIGHPHVYLNGNTGIPVEFISGKPLINIEKTKQGYSLKADVAFTSGKKTIWVRKETNTRYIVYYLTDVQNKIIGIISEQDIVVPEEGIDKLTKLVADLSAQGMEVHSDLSLSENTGSTIQEAPVDTKIRVQLLPYKEGLKAELFSKPFGDAPPYCKPGKGGGILIRNSDNNVQFQVRRDLKKEAKNENTLLNAIQSLESLNMHDDIFSFDNPMDALYLLDILQEQQDICIVEWPEGERFKLRGYAGFANLSLNLRSGTDWFSLQGELKIDENTVLTLQQLLTMMEKGHGRFVELSSGEFIALSDELRKRLIDLQMYGNVSAKDIKINKFASIAIQELFDNAQKVKTDKKWKDFCKQIDQTKITDVSVPSSFKADLRPYQEEGFRWMSRLATWECGACLADDMGLGKTVQTLAVLLSRADKGPALVVCPVSVIGNWISEVNRFAPSLQIKTLGTTNRQQTLDELHDGDILITSYGLLQSEEALFKKSVFATVVLDEAHVIKNFATKTSKAIMQLQASFKLILTGTPIQNHLLEIWNLFNFINPGLLGNVSQFTTRFVKDKNEQTQKQLKKLIAPFILRRTKSKVLDELPSKTEIIKKVRLSDEEMAFYEALRRQAIENISNADNDKNNGGGKRIQVLAEITRLRQACCNPQLIDKKTNIRSSKLTTFLDTIHELIENKHRVLVFSQFVKHLTIVREALDEIDVSYQYLDGSTPVSEREKRVRQFQKGEGELFLISLKAGGLGLNLTAADYVIHLDPWWNPAVEDQASDRTHRIGQTRPVTIYRLVAENTIEEKIIQLHNTKRDLADSLLEGTDHSSRLSIKELMDLITTSYV